MFAPCPTDAKKLLKLLRRAEQNLADAVTPAAEFPVASEEERRATRHVVPTCDAVGRIEKSVNPPDVTSGWQPHGSGGRATSQACLESAKSQVLTAMAGMPSGGDDEIQVNYRLPCQRGVKSPWTLALVIIVPTDR